jgi:hypothetical protein
MSFGSKGEQLKMFMTPNEIHAQYQPLDADREESESEPWASGGTPRSTARSQTEGNVRHGLYRRGVDTSGTYQASTYGTKYRGGDYEPESDEQLWDRKLDESQYEHTVPGKATLYGTPHYHGGGTSTSQLNTGQQEARSRARDYDTGQRSYWTEQVKRPSTEETSLYDSIQFEGVKSPIRLGQTVGSMGKREIVGGHHRLASQTDIDPNRLVPVLHHEDIFEAKSNPSYKYT